ncbi:PD-(D/E)XK motif protein [Streptomyces sp. SID14478]|uniref:PD-(D/E)XK motif protein n=1 Tax=Streptomyces sp. SID14478 TaxID=2706073 RepID=UPI0013D9AB32|nr:PD-(D/E)XK motif protein [Streptomyces sp. SID14478]NEB74378.1 PD-(D/E)XK motif protein [Streptomyces sp. SID14478]
MSENSLRELVEGRWTALEAEHASDERGLRVSQLPVVADQGPLAVAVDYQGHRHVLVPIHANRKIRPGLNGPALQLRKRPLEDADSYQTYADLACLRDDLNDLFTELCVDVLGAAREIPDNPSKALYRALDRWKALLRTEGEPLGPEQLAGLFGELTVLNRLLEKDPSAHRFWHGPERHRHDFSSGSLAVEVKSSAAGDGRRPRIHGLDQLDAPEGGSLFLAWFRLQRTHAPGTGLSFLDVITRALRLCDDESAFLDLLAAVGYSPADADRYRDVRFLIDEERWYKVDADFPKLTYRGLVSAGVPVSALDVEYTIDLSGETPAPLIPDEISRTVDNLIQESA